MHVRRTLVAAAAWGGAAFAMAGCSSTSSRGAETTSAVEAGSLDGGSGQADASGRSSDQADTSDGDSGRAGPSGEGGTCSTYPGVTVTSVDAGVESPTWSCIEASCMTQLATCAADCTCNDLILKALFASHDLASANDSFTAALSTGGPPADAILVGVCLQLNQSNCPMWGADAAAGH